MRNVFKLDKKAIKEIMLSLDVRNHFENKEKENCYERLRVSNFWSNKYSQPARNIPEIFAECFLSVTMFRTSRGTF